MSTTPTAPLGAVPQDDEGSALSTPGFLRATAANHTKLEVESVTIEGSCRGRTL
jgi:hypothetical protein